MTIKTGDWKKISVILSDCLEIKHSERQKYLDELKISSELRAEVETYLAFEENVEGLMDVSAVEFSKEFF